MIKRKLYIIGPIDWESYATFSEDLDTLVDENNKKPITIELASDGGDAQAALAFYDKIRNCVCDVTVIGTGSVASAAVLILAAGDYKVLTRSAWVMVHEEVITEASYHSVTHGENEFKHYRALENQWNYLLSICTSTSADKWGQMHKCTTYLTAQDCLALGLVDRIL